MSLFGSGDPIDDLLDEEGDVDRSIELPDEDEWKYAFNPVGTEKKSGREMVTYGDDDGTFMGEVPRQMVEARRFNPEAYTRFGYTKDPNRGVEEVGVPFDSLFKHVCLFGQSGYGKSTVMRNMIIQWIQGNHGVCFVDPKGDDSPKLMKMIPEHRREDVVWVEPGSTDRNSVVGFNFFDTYAEPGTPEHEAEAEQVAEEFVNLLRVFATNWSPQMTGTAMAIVEQLVKAEENYTPVDFYAILDSTAERDAFLEMYGDRMEDIARDYVENFEPSEMGPLISKVEEMSSKPVLRELIAHDNSKISLAEIVEEGKVLLVNISNLSEDMQLVAAAFVRRIWSTISARSSNVPEEADRRPFYLALDEFKDLCKDFPDQPNQLEVGEIISKARSLRMSLMVATQQPSQLPEDIKESVYKAENLFTFNTGDFQDAAEIAKGIGDIDQFAITELGAFKILGRVTIDGQATDGLLVHTFPEYPPLRGDDGKDELIAESLERYGSPKTSDAGSMDSYGVERYLGDQDATSVTADGTEITPSHVRAAIASSQSRTSTESFHGYDDWVAKEDIKAVFKRHTPEVDYDDLESDIIRPLTGSHIEQVERNNNEFFRLTESGEEAIFTGSRAGTEGDLALSGLRYLSSLGQQATLPLDDEDSVYFSAEAEPPIKPTQDAETMAEAETLHMALQTSYPEIADHFRDSTLMMSVNPDPARKPRELATCLATRQSRHDVFVIPERFPDDSPAPRGAVPAEYTTNLLTYNDTPAFVKAMDADGYRTFYTSQRRVELGEGAFALAEGSDIEWCERGSDKHLELIGANGETLATFDNLPALQQDNDPDYFPLHCEPDDDGGWVVKEEADTPVTDEEGEPKTDDDGELITTNDGFVKHYDTLDAIKADGYTIVREPLIPETILPSATPDPDPDSWTLIVVPERGDPYIYDDTETNTGTDTETSQGQAAPTPSTPTADDNTSADVEPDPTQEPDADTNTDVGSDTPDDESEDANEDGFEWDASEAEPDDSESEGDDDVDDPFRTV